MSRVYNGYQKVIACYVSGPVSNISKIQEFWANIQIFGFLAQIFALVTISAVLEAQMFSIDCFDKLWHIGNPLQRLNKKIRAKNDKNIEKTHF